jgi:Zn-finger nucleic acid-binding protein
MKQAIKFTGGGKLTDIRWSTGVSNDVFSQLTAGLRYDDISAMEMDGSPRAKGITLDDTIHVPPGYVFGYDKKSVAKMVLLPKPGKPAWDDGEKIPDRSAYVFPLDYPCQIVWLNRGNLAYASNKTEL